MFVQICWLDYIMCLKNFVTPVPPGIMQWAQDRESTYARQVKLRERFHEGSVAQPYAKPGRRARLVGKCRCRTVVICATRSFVRCLLKHSQYNRCSCSHKQGYVVNNIMGLFQLINHVFAFRRPSGSWDAHRSPATL